MAERALSVSVISAIEAGTIRPAIFFEGEYDSGGSPAYLRLFTGVGQITWDSKVWTGGRDLLAISPIRETKTPEAIGFEVTLSGLPASNLSLVLQSLRKNKPGKLWLGFFQAVPYLSLPGTAGNYASTPDSVPVSITGDIDIRVKVALNDWTPADFSALLTKWISGSNREYWLGMRSTGAINFQWFDSGGGQHSHDSTANLSAQTANNLLWLRVTLDINNGAGSHDVKFFTSTDGMMWTQLGNTATTAGTTSIRDAGSPVEIGSYQSGSSGHSPLKCHYAEIRNGIDGTVVAAFDPARAMSSDPATIIAATGETWTINKSGSPAAMIVHPQPTELIADPYPLRRGRFDVAPISRDGETMTIRARYEDRLIDLERPRDRRYTHEDQQLRLAGDKGFDQVPELQDVQDAWG